MSLNGYAGSSYSKPVNRPIPTRTGSLKLNKGEKVYFYFYNGDKKTTFDLKVK